MTVATNQLADIISQAGGLRSKHKHIAGAVADSGMQYRVRFGKQKAPLRTLPLGKGSKRRIDLNADPFMVIQSSAAQMLVAETESQWLDQVQAAPGIRAEPNDIASIRRYFRFDQDDFEHEKQMDMAVYGRTKQRTV